MDSTTSTEPLTPHQERALLVSIFGDWKRGWDCDPCFNCTHEPVDDKGRPNPVFDSEV